MKGVTVLLLCCIVRVTHQLQWQLLAADNKTEGPGSRRDCALGYHDAENRLFLFGGRSKGKIHNDTWYYDFDDKNWTMVNPTTAPEARFTMAFGVWDNKMFISTGEGPKKVFYNDVWRQFAKLHFQSDIQGYVRIKCEGMNVTTCRGRIVAAGDLEFDFVTMQWDKLPQGTNPPEERYGAAGGIYPGQSLLWMSHGFADIRYSNTFTYDLINSRNKWVEEFTGTSSYNPRYPHARCVQGATPVTPDHFVMYGGCLGGGETGGPCPSSDSWLFSRVNKKWKRLEECFSPRMFPAMAPLPMGVNKLRYRAVMYGGGQKRPIEDTDEFSVVWVDEAPMDEIGVFTLHMSNEGDDDPSTKWERRRAKATNGTDGIPSWRIGHSFSTVREGILMFGGGKGDDIWLLKGDVDSVDESELIGDGCSSKYWSLIHFHGLFMFLGWGLLLVAGVFVARFLKHKDPLWFHLHRIFQVVGLLFSIGGFICGVMSVPSDHFKFGHGAIGLIVFLIGLLQALNGALRPHKQEGDEQTIIRRIWEFCHRFFGRSALILAQVNISLGMFLAVVPTAVFAVWFGYLGVWVFLFVLMNIKKCRSECGNGIKPGVSSGNYQMNSKL